MSDLVPERVRIDHRSRRDRVGDHL